MTSVYKTETLKALLSENSYPGRGIVVGLTPDGGKAVAAYFIMGRSENSRNRVFRETGSDVTIYSFDESKVEDPTLIIYSPIRVCGNDLIVTNGDQTDTVYEGLQKGMPFAASLEARCFEPDAPNFTPRISAILHFGGDYRYEMSILKSADEQGSGCNRFTYAYTPIPGLGHFLHTYRQDGNPLPTFTGEPERVALPSDIDALTTEIWENLDSQNKISLYVRYVNLATGESESRMRNKNG